MSNAIEMHSLETTSVKAQCVIFRKEQPVEPETKNETRVVKVCRDSRPDSI